MRISSIHLKNFKRFTDLLVKDIPPTAKVVVVVGPNGCGKSSLLDALFQWYRWKSGIGWHDEQAYFRKSQDEAFDYGTSFTVKTVNDQPPTRGSLYVRTAYRHESDFSVSRIDRPHLPTEGVRFSRLIDMDSTVSDNYRRLVYQTVAGVYDDSNDMKSVLQLRNELIGSIQASMKRVFGDLLLNNISNPLESGSFFFEKGAAKAYHYKNLSGGEKAAFDLLLDVHIKRRFYPNAVYCIDEVETHLHTQVQGALVRELAATLEGDSQLWVTTHSLGVLRAAQEMAAQNPGAVAVIDFHSVDPDVPRVITPSNLGRVSWNKMLSITLDDLTPRIAPKWIVVCEGSSSGASRKDFDATVYNKILGEHAPDVFFVSGGNSEQVAGSGANISETLKGIFPASKVIAISDRDEKSADEITRFEQDGNLVLPKRNLESYLLAEDVFEALCIHEEKLLLIPGAFEIRKRAIDRAIARGKPAEDLKAAAGDVSVELKKLLSLKAAGSDKAAFLRDTMAPLITPSTTPTTYQELKAAVIDRLS